METEPLKPLGRMKMPKNLGMSRSQIAAPLPLNASKRVATGWDNHETDADFITVMKSDLVMLQNKIDAISVALDHDSIPRHIGSVSFGMAELEKRLIGYYPRDDDLSRTKVKVQLYELMFEKLKEIISTVMEHVSAQSAQGDTREDKVPLPRPASVQPDRAGMWTPGLSDLPMLLRPHSALDFPMPQAAATTLSDLTVRDRLNASLALSDTGNSAEHCRKHPSSNLVFDVVGLIDFSTNVLAGLKTGWSFLADQSKNATQTLPKVKADEPSSDILSFRSHGDEDVSLPPLGDSRPGSRAKSPSLPKLSSGRDRASTIPPLAAPVSKGAKPGSKGGEKGSKAPKVPATPPVDTKALMAERDAALQELTATKAALESMALEHKTLHAKATRMSAFLTECRNTSPVASSLDADLATLLGIELPDSAGDLSVNELVMPAGVVLEGLDDEDEDEAKKKKGGKDGKDKGGKGKDKGSDKKKDKGRKNSSFKKEDDDDSGSAVDHEKAEENLRFAVKQQNDILEKFQEHIFTIQAKMDAEATAAAKRQTQLEETVEDLDRKLRNREIQHGRQLAEVQQQLADSLAEKDKLATDGEVVRQKSRLRQPTVATKKDPPMAYELEREYQHAVANRDRYISDMDHKQAEMIERVKDMERVVEEAKAECAAAHQQIERQQNRLKDMNKLVQLKTQEVAAGQQQLQTERRGRAEQNRLSVKDGETINTLRFDLRSAREDVSRLEEKVERLVAEAVRTKVSNAANVKALEKQVSRAVLEGKDIEFKYKQMLLPLKESVQRYMEMATKEKKINESQQADLEQFQEMKQKLKEVQQQFHNWANAKIDQHKTMNKQLQERDGELGRLKGDELRREFQEQLETMQSEKDALTREVKQLRAALMAHRAGTADLHVVSTATTALGRMQLRSSMSRKNLLTSAVSPRKNTPTAAIVSP